MKTTKSIDSCTNVVCDEGNNTSRDALEPHHRTPPLPLSARMVPDRPRHYHPSHSSSIATTATAAPAPVPALPMKTSRLQHALVDAQRHPNCWTEQLQSWSDGSLTIAEPTTTDPARARVASSQQAALAADGNPSVFESDAELTVARGALAHTLTKVRAAAATAANVKHFDRLVAALTTELSCSIENPAKRHETDVSCWYAFGKVVGKGTFGRVSSACHRLSATPVAIKSYFREPGATVCCRAPSLASVSRPFTSSSSSSGLRPKTEDADALDWKRVRQEVKMMAALKPHTSTIRFIEAFETPTQMHVVMEFVAGETLCDYMRTAQHKQQPSRNDGALRLSEPAARAVFTQLCAAVASLHDQNVIHRDLKLENVLVDACGRAKLIDFGFSQFDSISTHHTSRRTSAFAPPPSSRAPTATKNFCGTPSYMAPEVVACKSYDGKCVDVWSLGVVLYVLLCGKFPFQGQSFHQLYQHIRSAQCTFAGADRFVSKDAQALIRSVLVVDPTKRPRVHDILAHPWMTASDVSTQACPRATDLRFFDAFGLWDDAPSQVCTVLAQCLGLDATSLLAAVRSKRQNGATALVRLVVLAVEKQCAVALSDRPHARSDRSNSSDPARIESTALALAPSAVATAGASHKQHLEHLIGLVKASLTV